MEPGRVYEAIVILLIELFKKKVTFDLYGKEYTKQQTTLNQIDSLLK